MYVINARTHVCVRNDSETHSTGVTGSSNTVSCVSLSFRTHPCVNLWSHTLLTHWGQVTHICISKVTIIRSDNDLLPGRRQAIIWTNAGLLLIRPLGITSMKLNWNLYSLIQENAIVIRILAAILSRPQRVNMPACTGETDVPHRCHKGLFHSGFR